MKKTVVALSIAAAFGTTGFARVGPHFSPAALVWAPWSWKGRKK